MDFINFIVMNVGLVMDFTSSDFHLSRISTFSCSIHSKNRRMSLSCTLKRRAKHRYGHVLRAFHQIWEFLLLTKKGRFWIEEIGDWTQSRGVATMAFIYGGNHDGAWWGWATLSGCAPASVMANFVRVNENNLS